MPSSNTSTRKSLRRRLNKQPVISVDTKKKELIGNFKNGGTDTNGLSAAVRARVPLAGAGRGPGRRPFWTSAALPSPSGKPLLQSLFRQRLFTLREQRKSTAIWTAC
jgi:hypothetical protein